MDKYFESLDMQTCKDFEVIVIDDCSIDKTYENIDKTKKKYSFSIQVVKNDYNGGPGNARNKGLKLAMGEYILFIDSDDYVATNLIEELRTKTEDMIFFDYCRIGVRKSLKKKTLTYYNGDLSKESVLINCTTSICGKAVKRKVIEDNGIFFSELKRYEDWVFMTQAIIFSNSYSYVQKSLYYYKYNPDSLVNNGENDAHSCSLRAFDILEKQIISVSKEIAEALYAREVLYITTKELSEICTAKQIWPLIKRLEGRYPKWYKNVYIDSFSNVQKVVLFFMRKRLLFPIKLMVYFRNMVS